MKTNEYMKEMNSLIKAASDSEFTLNVQEIAYFIILAVKAICQDLKMKRMKTVRTDDEVVEQLNNDFLNKYSKVKSTEDDVTSRKVLYEISYQAFTLLSGKDYRKDTFELIQRIKKDAVFARHFFYDAHFEAGKNMAGIRMHIVNQIYKDYHINIEANLVSTMVYEHLWSDGTWANLNAYNYRSTFYQWLGTVASRCMVAFLIKNEYIHPSFERTVSNTKLCWEKQDPDYCAMAIDDLIHLPQIHDFLYALCADRLDKDTIKNKFDINEKMYNLLLKTSVKTFKTALLNTENNYEDFLADKSVHKIKVSTDDLNFQEWDRTSEPDAIPFEEFFGINSEDPDIDEKAKHFLCQFSERVFKKKINQFIWQERYIKNTSPVVLAKILGRTRAWVDTRYSRLNPKFWLKFYQYWQRYNSNNQNLSTSDNTN